MKTVILIGEGCRDADLSPLLAANVPILSSWQAADLIDNNHKNYFGRPGVWGQRCANRVLYNADLVIAIGNRMAVTEVGHTGLRKEQKLCVVDVDEKEGTKFTRENWINKDAGEFIKTAQFHRDDEWFSQCCTWRSMYPYFDQNHRSKNEYISPYDFVNVIQQRFLDDEIIVTDMGHALTAAHQVLKLNGRQRLMTSGGLGEMGCGLPAAIGAAFASGSRVICLNSDGGMMLNLQELQTVIHHNLPIKIIVFSNDGYGMIKSTMKNLKYPYSGVDKKSGVSCPDYVRLAQAFGIQAAHIKTWQDYDEMAQIFFNSSHAFLLEVQIDPEQVFSPKLQPIIENGVIRSPSFEELT